MSKKLLRQRFVQSFFEMHSCLWVLFAARSSQEGLITVSQQSNVPVVQQQWIKNKQLASYGEQHKSISGGINSATDILMVF